MKWLVVLGGAALVGLVLLLLPARTDPPPAPVIATVPPPQEQPAARPPALAVAPAASAPALQLRGVLYQANAVAQSQALLSVQGQPAQVFRSGEPVAQGWSLQSIHPDHVVIASQGAKLRLDVVQGTRTSQDVATAASAAAKPIKEEPLPGFVRGPQGSPSRPESTSVEGNRRFMQDRQNKASGVTTTR